MVDRWEMNGCGRRASGRRGRRRGGIILELILVLPIFLILLFAAVQFGFYFARMQQVAMASRVGALEASQTAPLPLSGGVPANVREIIERQLDTNKMRFCKVRVEHNVGGAGELESPTVGACDCCPTAPLASPPPDRYVRVTVCVPRRDLMPECLGNLGITFGNCDEPFSHTTVMRYELEP